MDMFKDKKSEHKVMGLDQFQDLANSIGNEAASKKNSMLKLPLYFVSNSDDLSQQKRDMPSTMHSVSLDAYFRVIPS
jgi:hypothetical protein